MNLIFETNKQKLIRIDDEEIATFSKNYITTTFIFDEVWYNLKKYALFTTPDDSKYLVKLGYGKELTCKIPNDVLQNAFFNVSVFADDLLTSTQETVFVSSSGYILDLDDADEDDIIEGEVSSFKYDESRKKHYDEEINERLNRFEISEHPYL